MFNIDPPNTPNKALVSFANKHEIKKMVTSDGSVRWFGCRDGLDYTNKTGCSWPDGIGVPPCDLWNLGEVVSFVMQACERGKMVCEYVAGDIVGKEKLVEPQCGTAQPRAVCLIIHEEKAQEIMSVKESVTPFTLGQMIPDSSLIRNVLTSDSFYRLHSGT